MNTKALLAGIGHAAVALLIALLLGGIVIAISQHDASAPVRAYAALFTGAFGSPLAVANTLSRSMPLLLTGVGICVALSAGLFNIGAEGQLAVGGLAAAVVGVAAKGLPAPLILLLALAASGVVGAAWAFLPAYLKEKRGAHEVITAILLNYVAQNITRYLVAVPLKDPTSGGNQRTREVAATLPRLLPQFDVHAGLIIAVVAVVVIAILLRRTVWGYETRMTGAGAGAAEAAGIPVAVVRIRAMLVSGALCGLAGAVLVLGVVPFKSYPADFYGAGYGFDGLAVALLAAGNPFAVLPSALLFGALGAGAEEMDFNAGIPKQIVAVVQALLIVAVAARFVLRSRRLPSATPARGAHLPGGGKRSV